MSAPTPISSSAEEKNRWQRVRLAVLLWLYGISITIFLFSIWGRAVVVDAGLLSDVASRAADSELVTSRVESWFDQALGEAGLGETSGPVSEAVVALPEVRSATADLAGAIVEAAAEPSTGPITVDVAAIYAPAVPAVTAALASAGAPVGEDQVAAVVNGLDPLVLRTNSGSPLVGPRSGTARSLTVATLLALAAMVISGGIATRISTNRRAMLRALLNRLAVSAFTYAVFLRISAWVLDPRGGRATVRGGVAELLGSKLWIPLVITGVAATGGWAVGRSRLVDRLRRPASVER